MCAKGVLNTSDGYFAFCKAYSDFQILPCAWTTHGGDGLLGEAQAAHVQVKRRRIALELQHTRRHHLVEEGEEEENQGDDKDDDVSRRER
jgi:hypothetical protein